MLKLSVEGSGARDLASAMRAELAKRAAEAKAEIARANTGAARQVLQTYLQELRDDVLAGGFHNAQALSKTWKGKVYPDHKDALAPALYVSNKAAAIVTAFELGLTITVKGRRFLAVPVGPAVAIVRRLNRAGNRSRDATGRFVEEGDKVARVARALVLPSLAFHFDPKTGRGVLLAEGVKLTSTGRFSRRGGPATVLFILLKQATLKKRIRGRALLASFDQRFGPNFEAALAARS